MELRDLANMVIAYFKADRDQIDEARSVLADAEARLKEAEREVAKAEFNLQNAGG